MKTDAILLVEDNPDDIELTRIALAEAGLDRALVVARDGADALDYLFARGTHAGRMTAGLPAIVLLDVQLPKVDGHEVLRAIRAADATRSLPVVLLFSVDEPSATEAAGADACLRKPVDLARFAAAARQAGLGWLLDDAGTQPA